MTSDRDAARSAETEGLGSLRTGKPGPVGDRPTLGMPNDDELIERLLKIESDPIGCGLARNWHRNPDGPEAADRLTTLQDEIKRLIPLVEAAYREAWHEGYATGDAGGSYTAVELDWLGSDAYRTLSSTSKGVGVV